MQTEQGSASETPYWARPAEEGFVSGTLIEQRKDIVVQYLRDGYLWEDTPGDRAYMPPSFVPQILPDANRPYTSM